MQQTLSHTLKHTSKLRSLYKFSTISMPKSSAMSILGLNGNPSFNEIKRAYYLLSKRYHPDLAEDLSDVEKFKEIGEAYSTLKNLLREDDDELQSFAIKTPHFNDYDGKVCEEDVDTFKKYQKNEQGYDFCAEKGDLKCKEEQIYREIFGKSFQEDPAFFYDATNAKLREKFECIMEKLIEKEQFNVSNHEQKNAFFKAHCEGRKKSHCESFENHELHQKIGKMFKQ